MMKENILLFMIFMVIVQGYDSLSNQKEIIHYYELNSEYPIFHVFHNRHFSKSKEFTAFQEVMQTVDHRNHDYARFLLTDCDEIAQGKTLSCEILRRTKDNHMVVGYQPSTNFLNYGGKKIQNPPIKKPFSHRSNVYNVQEIQTILTEIMPNFYEEIDGLEQYEEWLDPYYTPNLIFASRDDQLPLVLIRLGVHYFLKFDLGFVSDLTNDVTKKLNITSFPILLVIAFNFTSRQHQIHQYPHSDFSLSQYEEIKSFLEPFALKKQRNDVLVHKIKMPTQSLIVTADNQAQLSEILDQANRWSLISLHQGKPIKLEALKDKYGDFFEYYHLVDKSFGEQTLQMFDPEQKQNYDLQNNEFKFHSLNKEQFVRNTSLWLSKDFVIVGVRQKYAHFCTLQLSTFFRGLIHCLAIRDSDYEQASKSLKISFDIGFVCAENQINGTRKVNWQIFKSSDFQTVYRTVEYITRQKSKEIVNIFLEKPINQIQATIKLSQLCSFPTKKCALLMTHPRKRSKTAFDYLSEVAKDFILEYQFFQIDLSCNPQFINEIENLEKYSGGLVVYHPRTGSYVYQKTKISKTAFKRFLKTSLKGSEDVSLHKFQNADIMVHSCRSYQHQSDSL